MFIPAIFALRFHDDRTLAKEVNYSEPTDSMVGEASCKLAGRVYNATDPAAPNFFPWVNHADGTCRNGNRFGPFPHSAVQKPCSFYNKTPVLLR